MSFLFIDLELIDALFIFIFGLIWGELLISFKIFILRLVERISFFNLIFFSISNLSEKLFINFPEAGMISPVPSSKSILGFTANNWFYSLFKGSLSFQKVLDPEAMHRFDISLGNKQLMYKPIHLQKYLVLTNKKNNSQAVMGCGHFVATIKRTVFDKGSSEPAFVKISNGIESKFIDIPNENLGFLRLATKENFAFHMGNSTEPWMFEEFKILKKEISNGIDSSKVETKNFNKKAIFIGKIYLRLLKIKAFRNLLFKRLGIKNHEEYSI